MLGAAFALVAALAVDGATLKGRATLRGEPVQHATLWLYRRSLVREHRGRADSHPVDEAACYWTEGYGAFDPLWLVMPTARLTLGDDARFEIDGLAPHRYRLVIETESGDRRALDPLTIERNALELDLGDVELEAACRIEGRVLLPEGVSGRGWKVCTEYLFHMRQTDVADDGRFVLEHLQPTLHHLSAAPPSPAPGRGAWGAQRIGGGETARIEIDARELRGCSLALDVHVNGSPARGVKAALTPRDPESWPCTLGPSDEMGRIHAWSFTLGRARAELTSALGLPLGRLTIETPLQVGADEQRSLDASATGLVIAWPADQRFETLTRIELNGAELTGAVAPFRVALDLVRDRASLPRGPTGEPRCELGSIAPGAYDLTLRLYSNHGDAAAFRKRVSIGKQAEFVCAMTPADSR